MEKRGERRRKSGSRDAEMFWQAALKERGWGVLQMHECNNGSRSWFHSCLNPGTLPLGNSPADIIPASSATLLFFALVRRRQADCAVPSVPPWGVCERAWAEFNGGKGGTPRWHPVLQRLCHKLLLHPCFILLIKAALESRLVSWLGLTRPKSWFFTLLEIARWKWARCWAQETTWRSASCNWRGHWWCLRAAAKTLSVS